MGTHFFRQIFFPALLILMAPVFAAASPPPEFAAMMLQDVQGTVEAGQMSAPDRQIRVQVWHDREDDRIYQRGESFDLHLRTNTDLYVVIYRIDADGYVEILWPTSRFDDGFVYGNHNYSLPQQGSPRKLRVGRSKGVEYIQAMASLYPFDLRALGIDFAFSHGKDGRYDYAVAGDPFLAVNDINFAITGLEEDVDYIVTDWTHLYVESKVDYPRYTCSQCHVNSSGHHPYVDHCSKVEIYQDYGWHSNWYVRFGYYPLYYEPPFYYWDVGYYRPYYFSYYPVYYSWPAYSVYNRPYYLFSWNTSSYYVGDYYVRYKSNVTRGRPLYDISPLTSDTRLRKDLRRPHSRPPTSLLRAKTSHDSQRNPGLRDTLVRSSVPGRQRTDMPAVRQGDRRRGSTLDTPSRSGVRTDVQRDRQRTIQSQAPLGGDARSRPQADRGSGSGNIDRSRSSSGAGESEGRRWTRPVIRNVQPTRDSSREDRRTVRPDRDRKDDRKQPPEYRPSRSKDKDSRGSSTPSVKPRSSSSRDRRSQEVKPAPRRSTSPPPQSVKPRSSGSKPSRPSTPAKRQQSSGSKDRKGGDSRRRG